MKALSFSQPWLWAVLHAGKHVENRPWAPPISMIEQRIALHAAASWDAAPKYPSKGDLHSVQLRTPIGCLLAYGFEPPSRRALYETGVIVATAVIDRVVTEDRTLPTDQKRWFFGPFGWILRDIRLLTTPVVATGKLGLWEVLPDARDAIFATGGA